MRPGRPSKKEASNATLDYYAEDYCVCEDLPELPDAAVYEGRQAVLERSRHWLAIWRDNDLTPVEFIDAGPDVVVVVVSLRGRGRESDAPTETNVAFVYEIRDGLVVRDRAFTSRSQALKAAGIEE